MKFAALLLVSCLQVRAEGLIELPVIFDSVKKNSKSRTVFFQLDPEQHFTQLSKESFEGEFGGELRELHMGTGGKWVYKGKGKTPKIQSRLQISVPYEARPFPHENFYLKFTDGYLTREKIFKLTVKDWKKDITHAISPAVEAGPIVKYQEGSEVAMNLLVRIGRRLGKITLPKAILSLI